MQRDSENGRPINTIGRMGKARGILSGAPSSQIKILYNMEEKILERLERIEQLSLLGAKNVLTMQDVSELTGLSVYVLREKVRAKLIPFSKQGGRLYFARVDVENWLMANRKQSSLEVEQEAIKHVVMNPKSKKGGRR